MKKNVLITLVIVLVILCLCFFIMAAGLVGFLAFNPPSFLDSNSGDGAEEAAEPTEIISAMPSSTPSAELSFDVSQEMDEIENQVVGVRGLQPKNPVNRFMLTRDELYQKVVDEFFADYTAEDAQQDVDEFSLIGLLEPDYDLYQLYIDLYSEQIAGYYDDITKEMYVVQGEGFNGTERMTYAHEYTHALQDQTYDLENGLMLNTDNCNIETEYCAAVTALIEGDATFTEQTWFYRYATEEDQAEVQDFYATYESPVYDSAPEFLKQDFLFPYQQGMEFVMSLYDRNGWTSIQDAYTNLPVSTEQILHPDKYPTDTPEEVNLPDLSSLLGSGWIELDSNVMGEWYTYLILAYGYDTNFRLPITTAKTAAAGWRGDAYAVYQTEDASGNVLVFRSSWETDQDASEYWDALTTYGEARWSSASKQENDLHRWESTTDGSVAMIRLDQDVVWLIAPDSGILDSLIAAVQAE